MEGVLQGSLAMPGRQERQEQPDISRFHEGAPVVNAWRNPSWAQGELIARDLQLHANDGRLSVRKEKQAIHKAQREEGFSIRNHQRFQEDIAPVAALLKTCAQQKDLCKGSRLHAHVRNVRSLRTNIYLGNLLISMYVKCGALAKAEDVFDELPFRNVVSWNALIAGYVQHGRGHDALMCFEQMQQLGLFPNAVTFICILKACGSLGAAEKGEEIHSEVVRLGLLEDNTDLGNALVDMYAKCGSLPKAKEVFCELPVRTVVSWNTLIGGYAQHEHGHEALKCFEQLQHQGLSPDAVTFTCILKACGSVRAAAKGEEIHAEVVREGLLEKDTILGNALVCMYARCSALAKAQAVFDELPAPNVISWNALIAGYAQHGYGHAALQCFDGMQHKGLFPDTVTFTCVLNACGVVGAARKGEEIHAEVMRQGLLGKDAILGNVLVDMYAKCGALAKAQEVFNELPVRNIVAWSALLAGYSQLGKVDTIFNLFNKMVGEDIEPNLVTFVVLLNACSHSGLLDVGQIYFETMSTSYGIIPTLEHHTCMVDLFARAGNFDKAIRVIKQIPTSNSFDYLPLWFALLGACQKWGNVKLGRLVFEHLVELDATDCGMYVCMSDLCAAASMQEEAEKGEAMSDKLQLPGHCWMTNGSKK